MNQITSKLIAVAVGLIFFSAAALAQNVSKTDYEAGKVKITSDYKAAKATCDALSGNAKDICVAEANGRQKVERAELEVNYKPTQRKRNAVLVAKADATYAVAKEKCDDLAGKQKSACVKKARAERSHAKADAKRGKRVD